MVLLRILSGKKADTEVVTRHFPFRIGRAANADLSLQEAGVWEQHGVLSLEESGQFQLLACGEAFFIVNGERLQSSLLRNGDAIEMGAAKIAFSLSPTRHHSLVWRESLTWAALVILCGAQVALIYWLAR